MKDDGPTPCAPIRSLSAGSASAAGTAIIDVATTTPPVAVFQESESGHLELLIAPCLADEVVHRLHLFETVTLKFKGVLKIRYPLAVLNYLVSDSESIRTSRRTCF